MFTLNIGQNRPDGRFNTADFITTKARYMFPRIASTRQETAHHGPFLSPTMERTVVVVVDEPWMPYTEERVVKLAEQLGQDAIAVWYDDAGLGQLIGPRAEKWGEFNPALFVMPSSKRLIDQL